MVLSSLFTVVIAFIWRTEGLKVALIAVGLWFGVVAWIMLAAYLLQ
jgi:hypothetical protein